MKAQPTLAQERQPLCELRVCGREPGAPARAASRVRFPVPTLDLAQQGDCPSRADLPRVEPDVDSDQVRTRLLEPVEQPDQLPQ